MRRSVLNIAAAFVIVAAGLPLMGSVASAQEPTVPGCDGDLVSASIEADSLPGGAWKVDGACVPKESYFTGMYKDAYPFAIGVAEVPYADGHTGRLALLEVQLRADLTIAIVGMEDQATSTLKFAGTLQGTSLQGTTAGASGEGLSLPPFEGADVNLALADTVSPFPADTTTTLPPEITTTLPGLTTLVPTTTEAPTTTVGPTSTTVSTTIPDSSTTVPTTTIP